MAASPVGRFASPQAYTPHYLVEKILTSRSALEGERKHVTVLFADLKGSLELLADRDPEEALAILDPVLERMIEAVHRYEGTVNQVMGDGIMALFGAPIAHEDHAVRACYAALAMQESVKIYASEVRRADASSATRSRASRQFLGPLRVPGPLAPLQIRVGLNSGEVVVRSIRSDLRMEYTAVGQTTHLAARMEQLATPGSILLAPDTLRLVQGYVQVTRVGPVAIKGLGEALDVYEALGVGPIRTRLQVGMAAGLTRFVGRGPELEALGRAAEQAGAGRGQVVAVVGEPGVGKSRLVWELTHSSQTQGWLALETAPASYGRATPYLPLIDLLRGYFGIEDRDDGRRAREKIADQILKLGEELRPTLSPLLALLGIPPEDPAWEATDPERRRQLTLEGARRLLLRESQRQPLLLVFEDLQWVDDETQAFLDGLVDGMPGARILLLVNYRPEYEHSWGHKPCYRQLRLDPLAGETADELLVALLGSDTSMLPLHRVLIERTAGNPFFLEESVRTLVETGVLVGERGAYRLDRPLAAVQMPATVQAMLAARIDRLDAEAKSALQVAAVVGHDVPHSLLQVVADGSEARLRESLAYLQDAEFLYETSLYPEQQYTFRHALTHEVAYGSLLKERRRGIHGRIVEAMEQLYSERLNERVEQLAHHAFQSEVWGKAVLYGERAARRSLDLYAYSEAVRFVEQALQAQDALDPDDRAKRCDLLLALAEALLPAGESQRVFDEVAEQALALAEVLGDQRRAVSACNLALDGVDRYGSGSMTQSASFRGWVGRLDRYAGPGTAERVRADVALWSQAVGRQDWGGARALQVRALASARELDDADLLFLAVGRARSAGFSSARHQAEELGLVDELMARPHDGVPLKTLVSFLGASQMKYLVAGERSRAETVWRELDMLASQTHDASAELWVLNCQIIQAALDGQLEPALEMAARLIGRAQELGSPVFGQHFANYATFWPLVYLGRAEEVRMALPGATRLAGVAQMSGASAAAAQFCAAYLGQLSEAREGLLRLLPEFHVQYEDEVFAFVLADLLATAVLVGERESAAFLAGRLAGVTSVAHTASSLSNVARWLGQAAVLLGDLQQARADYERALGWATKIRHRPEIALTRLARAELVAEHDLDERADAIEHLDFAIEEFRAMKMQPSLEQALRLREAANER